MHAENVAQCLCHYDAQRPPRSTALLLPWPLDPSHARVTLEATRDMVVPCCALVEREATALHMMWDLSIQKGSALKPKPDLLNLFRDGGPPSGQHSGY